MRLRDPIFHAAMLVVALAGPLAVRAADEAAPADTTASLLAERDAAADRLDAAWRLLWSDRAREAVPLFRAWLATTAGRDDRAARRGLALALSWSGQQDAAIALYRELSAADPADREARLGLARSLIWDNRLREGWRGLRALESSPGEPRDVGSFAITVLDGYDVPGQAGVDFCRDSDELEILRVGARATWEAAPSRLVQAAPSYRRYSQDGMPALTAWRLGAGLITPLASTWSLHAHAWVDHLRSAEPVPGALDAGPLRWTSPGGDAWLTWHARSNLRLDLGANRQPLETISALAREIALAQGSLSTDWRLAPRWSLGASCARGWYGDDNRRWLATARLLWRHEGRVALAAGPSFTWLDCDAPGSGYWSPDWMRNASLEASAQTQGARWLVRAAGRLGRETESGAEATTVGGWSARVGWRCAPGAYLALEGGHARSRLASAGGYSRDFIGLALRGFF